MKTTILLRIVPRCLAATLFAATVLSTNAQTSSNNSLTAPALTPRIPVTTLARAKYEVVSVRVVGSTSNPTGIETCVANKGNAEGAAERIGAAMVWADPPLHSTTYQFLGAFNPQKIAPGATRCETNGLADWQREMFKQCKVSEVIGGVNDLSIFRVVAPMKSFKPDCSRPFMPELPASMPIRPRGIEIPKQIPQPPPGPNPR